MTTLTQRQREVLTFIARHIEAKGFPPSIRDIGEAFEIHSNNAVNDHLQALVRKNLLERTAVTARGLRITSQGREVLR